MGKHLNDKTKIDIDLTSLLDVIFIILFVVMCQQVSAVKNAEDIADDATKLLYEVSGNNATVDDAHNAAMDVDKTVAFITLRVDYDKDDPKVRHFRFLRSVSTDEVEPLVVTKENEEEILDHIKDEITAYLEANKDMPVLVTIDDEQILYRDYQSVEKMLTEIKEEGYTNMFWQYTEDFS